MAQSEEYDDEFYESDEQESVTCWKCGGAGYFDLVEEDPLWFDEGDQEQCDECKGKGFLLIEDD